MMDSYYFVVVFLESETGYIAYVEELPGAHGEGATMEEAAEGCREAAEIILAANRQFTSQGFASGHVVRRSVLQIPGPGFGRKGARTVPAPRSLRRVRRGGRGRRRREH
jgi:predicted RNase H-like HicB family nuclease